VPAIATLRHLLIARSPSPGRRTRARPVLFAFSVFASLLACPLFAAEAAPPSSSKAAPSAPAPAPSPAIRQITHTPLVPQPPLDAPSDYLKAIAETGARYLRLYQTSDLQTALTEARNGFALAERAQRPRDEAEFLKALAYVNWLLGESASAIEYGQKLLTRADEFGDDRLRSFANRVIGTAHRQLGDIPKFRFYTELALAAAERSGDAALRYAALNNLGNVSLAERDLATARRLHSEVLAYREKINNRWDAAGSITNLADVAEAANDLPEALALQKRALALRTELDDLRGQVRSLRQVASVERRLGRNDEALAHLRDARARAEKIGGHELLEFVYGELARVHEARKEFADALAAERLANREREALAGERARSRTADLEAHFDLARKQQTIAALARDKQLQAVELHAQQAELESARWQRYGLLAIVVLGLIAASALVSRQRLKLAAEHRILEETRAARDAAEEADRVKTRFLGIASHDIRAPLGNIVNLTENLRNGTIDVSTRAENFDLVTSEAQRVLCLVEDLLATAALDSGKLELRPAPTDLTEIAHAVVRSLRWQAAAKRQALVLDEPPPDTGSLNGDAARLYQVVANLVTNAIKFSPPGGRVALSLARTAQAVTLSVRDDGPGIPPSEISRLFQPFSRLTSQPTGSETSHGLGLSIAHEIVRLHGGTIRVASQPGDGATFTIELPFG
jgi:signal transduction histidine kinase